MEAVVLATGVGSGVHEVVAAEGPAVARVDQGVRTVMMKVGTGVEGEGVAAVVETSGEDGATLARPTADSAEGGEAVLTVSGADVVDSTGAISGSEGVAGDRGEDLLEAEEVCISLNIYIFSF